MKALIAAYATTKSCAQ